ncbi:37S ribosomal protein S23 mitochondrial, partial [Nowakowskiella sp. JEL0078]
MAPMSKVGMAKVSVATLRRCFATTAAAAQEKMSKKAQIRVSDPGCGCDTLQPSSAAAQSSAGRRSVVQQQLRLLLHQKGSQRVLPKPDFPETRALSNPQRRLVTEFASSFLHAFPKNETPKALLKFVCFFLPCFPPSLTFFKTKFLNLYTPVLVFRKSSLDFINFVKKEADNPTSEKTLLLTGISGIGKSATLMQTLAYYHELNWIIIYIPKASEIISGTEPYAKRGNEEIWDQWTVSHNVLQSIKLFNENILSQVNLSKPVEIGETIAKTLQDLVDIGTDGTSHSIQALNVFFEELAQGDKSTRPPVLLAIDQINSLYADTAYHDTESRVIHASKFSFIKSMQDLMSRKDLKQFVIVGAMDNTDCRHAHSYLNTHVKDLSEIYPPTSNDMQLPLTGVVGNTAETKSHSVTTHSFPNFGVFRLDAFSLEECKALGHWMIESKLG